MMRDTAQRVEGLTRVSERTIYPHVFENADREVGGVLVGVAPAGDGLPLVTAAIPAIAAAERRATLTFTQDAWEHVHRVLDREHPDEQIVGWYHSHPGFGIFLSEHDLFIHRHFFSGPAQVALVVDPIAGTEGVFHWHGDEIQPLYECRTGGRWTAATPAPRAVPEVQDEVIDLTNDPRPYPLALIVLAVLVGFGVGLLGARAVEPGNAAVPTSTPAPTVSERVP